MSDCVFCKIARGEIPSERIYENDNFFSIFDISPQIQGHTLVISKKHFETILDMPNSLCPELLECIKTTSMKLISKFNADGFNIVGNIHESAGQIVPHVHVHIFPRKKNDDYNLSLNKK